MITNEDSLLEIYGWSDNEITDEDLKKMEAEHDKQNGNTNNQTSSE